MDNRMLLPPGTMLPFPGMECTVHAMAGRGSNAMVYEGGYPDLQHGDLEHRVLIKELFPYHPSGLIFRTPDGMIQWDDSLSSVMELHRTSFQRGNEIHLHLLQSFPADIGANLNTFSFNNTLYTVLGFSGGRSLERELITAKAVSIPIELHIRRILGAADALEAFHRSGYLHLDISPDNILLIGDGKRERVSLIDFNTVHTLQELRSGASLYYSEKEGYTAPEVRAGATHRVGPCSDLYSLVAVFFRCVSGRRLTILETSQAGAPDISGAPGVIELPGTALSMIRHILRRGLSAVAGKRYQDISELRKDLEELQDRIEGKGITHWALWETGRSNIQRVVKMNPAFSYLRDYETLYPAQCKEDGDVSYAFQQVFQKMTMPEGRSVQLVGGGGLGKTTALLSTAFHLSAAYSAAEPAVSYIPLYGWTNGSADYIKDRILETMRFKPGTDSMAMARHELLQLLSTPAHTKWGERPRLLLLLDGLNEANGDTAPLIREIRELSELPGVRLCVTSRIETDLADFQTMELALLKETDVLNALSANGLAPPEEDVMLQTLRTPMMLALYIGAAREEKKQIFVQTREELLEAYFSSLEKKFLGSDPTSEPLYWQAQAAICYVLPELARSMRKRGSSASDQNLLPTVERCWKRLAGRDIRKVFPQWIGHISSIRGSATDAESWYGEVVHELLWRRMGLIVRDAQGNYHIFHNLAEEYLLTRRVVFHRKFSRLQVLRSGLLVAILIAALAVSHQWLIPRWQPVYPKELRPYNEEKTKAVLGSAMQALVNSADQCDRMLKLTELLRTESISSEAYQHYREACLRAIHERELVNVDRTMLHANELLETGEVMPFSGEPLDQEALEALLRMGQEQADAYRQSIDTLDHLLDDTVLWDRYAADYLDELSVALDADIEVVKKRYALVLEPELSKMHTSGDLDDRVEYDAFMDTLAMITPLEMDTIQTYERIQFVAWNAVTADPIHSVLEEKDTK